MEFGRQACHIWHMPYPETYDPGKLEVAINPSNTKGGRARQWRWMVCEKSKGPIKSGIATGAYQNAVDAGHAALTELVARAQKRDAKS